MTTEAILVAAVLLSGLLAGNELATLLAFHPALRRLPLRSRIEAERALTRRRGAVMPVYLSAPLLAAAALGAMLAITLTRNVPLNRRTLAFPPDGDERAWSAIRRPRERLHALRVVLDVAAFACLVAAVAAR